MSRIRLVFGVPLLCLWVASIAFGGGSQEQESGPAELPDELTAEIWSGNSPPDGADRYRALNLEPAAESVEEQLGDEGISISINAEVVNDESGWTDFKRRYILSAEAGEAPDLVVSGHTDVGLWGASGYIAPIAGSVAEVQAMYPQFEDVMEGLWESVTWNGQIWGVPQDIDGRAMYYNRQLLSEMGWSDSEIEELPDRVISGDFTLEDLIETAQDGIEQGVVEEGKGYWHRPSAGGDFMQFYKAYGGEFHDPETDQLIIVEDALLDFYDFHRRIVTSGITPEDYIGTSWDVWHETVINGDVLFFNGGVWSWSGWASDQAEGGEEELFEKLGYTLIPAGEPGQEAGTLLHPIVYMVSSERASDSSQQDLMIQLLANMTETELNTRHAVESSHLAILHSQLEDPEYNAEQFLSDVSYFPDYGYYAPNHPQYGQYFDTIFQSLVEAQRGERTPEQAVQDVIERLQLELGDSLDVR